MAKVVKGPASTGQGGGNEIEGGLGGLLGGLLGGGGLGSILGAGIGAGAGNKVGGSAGSVLGGGLGALIPTLLPAVIGMLGHSGSSGQTGMHQLVDTMQANGLGQVAQSWVGAGSNQSITADQVQQVLTPEQVAELSAKSGLPADQVHAGVAAILPELVNHLTPNGAVPEAGQVQGATDQLAKLLGH